MGILAVRLVFWNAEIQARTSVLLPGTLRSRRARPVVRVLHRALRLYDDDGYTDDLETLSILPNVRTTTSPCCRACERFHTNRRDFAMGGAASARPSDDVVDHALQEKIEEYEQQIATLHDKGEVSAVEEECVKLSAFVREEYQTDASRWRRAPEHAEETRTDAEIVAEWLKKLHGGSEEFACVPCAACPRVRMQPRTPR